MKIDYPKRTNSLRFVCTFEAYSISQVDNTTRHIVWEMAYGTARKALKAMLDCTDGKITDGDGERITSPTDTFGHANGMAYTEMIEKHGMKSFYAVDEADRLCYEFVIKRHRVN